MDIDDGSGLGTGPRQRPGEHVPARSRQTGGGMEALGRDVVSVFERRAWIAQRAGLVEHDRVDLGQALERVARIDQDAVAEERRRRHRLDGGYREAQRAGAGDDEHCDRVQHRGLPAGARNEPAQQGRRGKAVDERRVELRCPVGEGPVAATRGARPLQQFADLGKQRVRAGRRRLDRERARQVERAGEDARSDAHGLGRALAGDQAVVKGRGALDHASVDADALARCYQNPLARPDRRGRDLCHAPPPREPSHGGAPQGQQVLPQIAHLRTASGLEDPADQQEEQQHHRGIEIGLLGAGGRLDHRHDERQQHGERYRHVHVEAPGPQRGEGALEEGLAGVAHDGKRDQRRDPVKQVAGLARHAAGRARPDRDREQHDVGGAEAGGGERADQPPFPRLRGGLRFVGRIGARRVTEPVEPGDHLRQGDRFGPGVDGQAMGGEVEARADDAGKGGDAPLDLAHAARAGGAVDGEHQPFGGGFRPGRPRDRGRGHLTNTRCWVR